MPHKFNLYSACVLSVLLYGSPAWHAGLTHLRLLEKYNEKFLRWCFGKKNYSYLLLAADTISIAYQLLNIDLKFFATIAAGKNCITFKKFFTPKKKNRYLHLFAVRTNSTLFFNAHANRSLKHLFLTE